MKCVILSVILLQVVRIINSECCPRHNAFYEVLKGHDCDTIPGGWRHTNMIPNNQKEGCNVYICGDGRPIVGSFCGRGSCNIFGCNCDGGCIKGDAMKNFKDLHWAILDFSVTK